MKTMTRDELLRLNMMCGFNPPKALVKHIKLQTHVEQSVILRGKLVGLERQFGIKRGDETPHDLKAEIESLEKEIEVTGREIMALLIDASSSSRAPEDEKTGEIDNPQATRPRNPSTESAVVAKSSV